MADGKVVIAVDVDGKEVTVLNNNLDQLEGKGNKASGSIKNMAISLGLVKVASAAIDVLKSSLDGAISRFDTMEKYPKVMSALGFSTDESSESVNRLADGIDGLPTRLDEVVSTAQRMTAVTGNLDKSTDATIALNNAMLASGASTADASRGMDQYIQMLSTGQVDLQSWKTLQETMPIGLQKTAEAMGFVGETAQRDLYGALKDGEITFNDFQNKLIELGTGTGELAELAKLNSEGIATSFSNLKNSTVKGLANVITAIDELSQATTGKTIASNLDSLKVIVNKTFDVIIASIKATEPVIKIFIELLKMTISVAKPLTPVLYGLVAAFVAFKVLSSINSLFATTNELFRIAALSGKALTLTTKAHMVAQVADTNATKADVLAKSAQNGAVKLSTLLIGLLSGGISVNTVVTTIATAATTAFSTAIKIMTGPIGIAVAVIGALVTATVALVKWFNKETAEAKKLNAEQEKLVSSTQELNDGVESSAKSRKESISSVESNSGAYKDLISQLDELTKKEHKTDADKKMIKSTVEELNESIDGLNLAYDEEAGRLNTSTDLINKRVEAMAEQEKANEAQSQLTEILKEQHEVEAKLSETNALREEWNQKLEDGSVKSREHKNAIAELDEQDKALTDTLSGLKTEQEETQATIQSATEAVTQATQDGVFNQIVSYETLTEAQQKLVDDISSGYEDLKSTTTNAFDAIEQKTAISMEEMAANLENNRVATEQWADNLKILAERGVDDGLLQTLRDGGPEMAAQTAELVNRSDEELAYLNDVYKENADSALDQYAKAHNLEDTDIPNAIKNMIDGQKATMKQEIDAADFSEIGKNVAKGAADGVKDGTPDVEKSSKDMGKKTSDAFKDELEIHSPSRKFMRYGKFLDDGLAQGITLGQIVVLSAMKKMANAIDREMQQIVNAAKQTSNRIPQAFNSLPNQMNNVGMQAMYGLANGIYSSSAVAINAAQSVADRIKSTIQGALDIHSPSRWMRDEIGRRIPQGVALGIDEYADTAYRALNSLGSGLKKSITPEKAIDVSGMWVASGGNQVTNHSNTTKTINNQPQITMHVAWEGKEDIRRTMEQIAFITSVDERGGLE